MGKYLYHISLEGNLNEEKTFTPRVPNTCMQDEDKDIPRICTSETIRGCIAAFPYRKDLDDVVEDGSAFMYLYKFDIYALGCNNLRYYYQIERFVPDAMYTKETWITKEVKSEPEMIRIDRSGNIEYTESDNDRTFEDVLYEDGEYVDEIISKYNVDVKSKKDGKISILYKINKGLNCSGLWDMISKNHNHKYNIFHRVNEFNKSLENIYK